MYQTVKVLMSPVDLRRVLLLCSFPKLVLLFVFQLELTLVANDFNSK